MPDFVKILFRLRLSLRQLFLPVARFGMFSRKHLVTVLCVPLIFGCGEKISGSVDSISEKSQKSVKQQVALLQNKAESGDVGAQVELGKIYLFDKNQVHQRDKAEGLLLKAARAGSAEAQYVLGELYWRGEVVSRDFARAADWLAKAAAQGHAPSKVGLGILYSQGKGVPIDSKKAISLYEEAATSGERSAYSELGASYLTGKGVPKNRDIALDLFMKAAAAGDAAGQIWLGRMYQRGDGVVKDEVAAVKWWQRAADQGHPVALVLVGEAYQDGEGIVKDLAKGAELYLEAARRGSGLGAERSGWAYETGTGFPPDFVLAYAWYNLAAAFGEAKAISSRGRLEKLLPQAEVQEAQRLASSWKQGDVLVRERVSSARRPGGQTAGLSKTATGTVFVVTSSGKAVTNYHLVDGCAELRISGRGETGTVIAVDRVNDLALIQLSGEYEHFAAIARNPQASRQGEAIAVFGFPLSSLLASGGNLTQGVISGLAGLGGNTSQIQITAPVQLGSSGSPVLSMKGDVLGVVSMKLSDAAMASATGSIGQNVNFAVGGSTLRGFLILNHIDFRSGKIFSFDRNPPELADQARKWTFGVECWK